jgi:glycosyltransferase involved in cell wall biosynthesis
MIEAMARGTPVLAFRCGSVPEVIEDGVTGNVVDSEQEAIAALPAILAYDRHTVRQRFESDLLPPEWPAIMSALNRQLLKIRTSGAGAAPTRSQWRQRLSAHFD